MSKEISKITNEELRELLHSFDTIDTNLDNMEIKERPDYSDAHLERMSNYFEEIKGNARRDEELSNARGERQRPSQIFKFALKEKRQGNERAKHQIKFRNYKIAMGIAIVLLAGFACNFDAVLAYTDRIKFFVVQKFEEYSVVSVEKEEDNRNNALQDFELEYESNCFYLVDEIDTTLYKIYKYKNDESNYLKIVVSSDTAKNIVDTEDAKIVEREIDGTIYYCVEKYSVVQIYYFKGDILYRIESDIPLENLWDEIENIK